MTEERRRRARFQIRQPISLEIVQNGIRTVVHGTTENVSLVGVLVLTDEEVPENTRVDLTLTLATRNTPPHPLRLPTSGRVTRVEAQPDGTVSIAIECCRPFELVTVIHAS